MNKVAFAAKWSIITEVIVKFISPITNMILARLLSPELFGIVASVTLVTTFTDIFTDAGFQKYIIQHQFKDNQDYDLSVNVAFWTNLCVSVLMWSLICVFRSSIAKFVGCDGYGKAVAIASIVLIFTSFSSIQTAIFKKQFEFKRLSFIRIIGKLVPFFITIPLALFGMGYWSLIIGNVIGELVNAAMLTFLSKWHMRPCYSLKKLKSMFSFCGWSLCEAVTAWLVANLGVLLIGQYFSSYYLGIYKGAITVVNQILSIINAVMSSVILTVLSSYQSDRETYKKMVLNFQRTIAMIMLPLGMGVFVFRDLVTKILLGGSWSEASILVGIWGAVSSINIVFANMNSYILLSRGKPKYTFVSNVIQCFTIIIAFMLIHDKGFYPMFYSIAIATLQLSLTQTIFAKKVFKISEKEKFKNIFMYVIATAIMGLIGQLIHNYSKSYAIDFIGGFICVLSYFAIIFVKKDERRYIKELFLNFVKAK